MKISKFFILGLCLMLVFSLAACGNNGELSTEETTEEEETTEIEDKGTLMMATTTSTADTGILDYLAPLFKADTGWTLEYTSVGTGEALYKGENGDVDIVLVHAEAREEAFVEAGYGIERVPVMYSDYVVIGPAKPIAHNDDIAETFVEIVDNSLPFINRGDDSETDKKEKVIWEKLGLDPTGNPNYVESGQDMSATIIMADEQRAYCLSDRVTFLKQKGDSDLNLDLDIVCEKDEDLLNQYGVIAVNPEKHPDTNIEGANDFIEWITSDEVQALIGEFGVDTYGQALFVPNAGKDA